MSDIFVKLSLFSDVNMTNYVMQAKTDICDMYADRLVHK
jgi:hypothetical protein